MDTNNILGEVLEKGQTVVKKTGKAVADSASGAAKAAANQVTGDSASQPGTNEANTAVSDNQQAGSDKSETEELVRDLYSPSKSNDAQSASQATSQSKSDEQAQLASVRQKLHDEVYYEPLVEGQKAKEEERPAEKVEKEKKMELQDLQKKEAKKPAPLVVQRAQQSAEKFRGVSG